MIKVGVIGVGSMGQHHVRIYSEMKNVELVGISDVDNNRLRKLRDMYKTKAFTDYRDLLNEGGENLDAVSVAVPTTLHKDVSLDLINRGINVLIEKPIADSIENAVDIIKAAKKNKVKLMIGHIERFNVAVMKLKKLIDSGELGDIVSIYAKRVGPYNPRIRDVGIITDLGTHDIDIMSYLYNEKVKEVYASAGKVFHNYEDHAIILLNFRNGNSGVIETNWLTPHKVRKLTVVGTKGIAEVDYIQSSLRVYDKEWIKDVKIEKKEPLKLELEHFIDCVENDKEPLVTGKEGKEALEVAIAAMHSYKAGKVCEILKKIKKR
jgi:UDP-N-acetylglucosamine 3-dehydrogenase